MSKITARPALSEKGLLTPGNCVVAMIDLQPQLLAALGNPTPIERSSSHGALGHARVAARLGTKAPTTPSWTS